MTEKNWIKRRFDYVEFDTKNIESILLFSLIWNIFEKGCCGNFAKINIHCKLIARNANLLEVEVVNMVWKYFLHRYIVNGRLSEFFISFEFNPNDNKAKVENILLKGNNASHAERVEALLRICFRLKNNLTHGIKDVGRLYAQNENFRQANILLMHVVERSGV